ncbi:MAG: S-adenosylmethionine:tRNA ribosyltransferase-isomerase, partial [Actinomycetota bacterium]|nr:S-adenosylmethionine:tRNA ribosyltransferase-isomerase [Actinomycetota bacterium]
PGGRRRWVLEVRDADGRRHAAPGPGATVALAGGGRVRVIASLGDSERLVVADLMFGAGVLGYLHAHGQPIRYLHAPGRWPLEAYQTIWAHDLGSAEMPSAGRPFTAELVVRLISAGVRFAPVLLHAGVSSLEAGEDPFPERFAVSADTARMVSATRAWGGRVIAVGTTVVRALESVAAPDGTLQAAAGTTDLVVTPERGVRVVDGLITGWHEAEASHLRLLEAIAGPDLLTAAYDAAVRYGHRGHEFGDVNLILP